MKLSKEVMRKDCQIEDLLNAGHVSVSTLHANILNFDYVGVYLYTKT